MGECALMKNINHLFLHKIIKLRDIHDIKAYGYITIKTPKNLYHLKEVIVMRLSKYNAYSFFIDDS
jgi:hypothetical protein